MISLVLFINCEFAKSKSVIIKLFLVEKLEQVVCIKIASKSKETRYIYMEATNYINIIS